MANKKISELTTRTPSLSDLMLVGDPSSGYSFKCTVTALATIIETDIADGYVTLGTAQTISGAKTFSNNLTLTSVSNAGVDTDKFLVLSGSNVVNFRTGAEVLSDIGAQAALTNPITGTGTSGQVSYFNGTNSITSSPTFAFTPTSQLLVNNSVTASGASARGVSFTSGLTAAANNDVLVGLDVLNTFNNGAFTGVGNYAARFQTGSILLGTNNSVWGSPFITMQRNFSALAYNSSNSAIDLWYASYFDGTSIRYNTTFAPSRLSLDNNGFRFFSAAAGVSGNTFTFTETMRLFTTGNLALNTTTDAGFRLDVNGTARVQGTFTAANGIWDATGIAVNNIRRLSGTLTFNSDGGTLNSMQFTATSSWPAISSGTVRHMYNDAGFAGSGTSNFSNLAFTGTLNTSTTGNITYIDINPSITTTNAASTVRGIFYNPAFTSIAGAHRAIQTVSGDVLLGTTSGNVAIGGGTSPAAKLEVSGSITAASAIARGVNFTNTLVAAANNDVLVGLDINPTFTNGAFTGVSNLGLRVQNDVLFTKASGNTSFTVNSVAASTTFVTLQNGTAHLSFNVRGSGSTGNMGLPANAAEILAFQKSALGIVLNSTAYLAFGTNTTEQMRLVASTGNLLLNTTTDAGFRLDIGGTARVQGNITGTGSLIFAQTNSHIIIGNSNTSNFGVANLVIGNDAASGISGSNVTNNVIIGNLAFRNNSRGYFNTVVGYNALTNSACYDQNTVIGESSLVNGGAGSTYYRLSTLGGSIISSASAAQYTIALGFQARITANNQFIAGSLTGPATDIYFGSGVQRDGSTNGAGSAYTINGSGGLGTDQAGGNITIAGGKGTGAGTAGDVIFSTSSLLASGTTLQSLTNRMFVKGNTGNVLIGTSSDVAGRLQIQPANDAIGVAISGSSLTGSNGQSLVSLSQTWNTTGNPTAFLLNITNTASGATADLMELQVGGVAQFIVGKSGTIQTTAPAGGTAATWKLGTVASVSPTSPNRTIEVEVGGTTYYLHAKTTND